MQNLGYLDAFLHDESLHINDGVTKMAENPLKHFESLYNFKLRGPLSLWLMGFYTPFLKNNVFILK